jgi:hypothetical protein
LRAHVWQAKQINSGPSPTCATASGASSCIGRLHALQSPRIDGTSGCGRCLRDRSFTREPSFRAPWITGRGHAGGEDYSERSRERAPSAWGSVESGRRYLPG